MRLTDLAHAAIYRRYAHLCTLGALYRLIGPYAPEYLAFAPCRTSSAIEACVLPLGMTTYNARNPADIYGW